METGIKIQGCGIYLLESTKNGSQASLWVMQGNWNREL